MMNSDIDLETLQFSIRVENLLRHSNIKDMESLLKESAGSLSNKTSCGKKSIKEIREKLAFYGLTLTGDILIRSVDGVTLTHDIPRLCENIAIESRKMNEILKDIQFRLHDLEEVIASIIAAENYKNDR